jgi:glucan phosphoethanolaminetransferase (alkaline phosphatase superfamily)
LTALAIVLPASWFRQRYVAQATALLIVSALLAVSIHTDEQSMTAWTTQKLWFWLALYILAVIAAWLVIQRYQRIEQGIKWVVQRTVLLSQVYVAISLLGLVVILIRNL